jgi:lipoate-protein ligase A
VTIFPRRTIRSMTWHEESVEADVARLHGLGVPRPAQRTVRWCVPTNSAIVLGSGQPESDVITSTAAELGIEVVRRRSGGGAVLVDPFDTVWVDVFIPADDDLWHFDVGVAFYWLGEVWAQALTKLGASQADVYRGPLVTSEWSKQVCFAGLGPGEVTVNGRKAVGLSQKRTREGALFQCSIYREFKTDRLLSLLSVAPSERARAHSEIEHFVRTLALDPILVRSSFLASLP